MTWTVRALGAVLLAASGYLAGRRMEEEYRRRVREIEGLIRCLAQMQAEITLRLTPMDEIFSALALSGEACAPFFRELADRLRAPGETTLAAHWRRAAEHALPPGEARDILISLGSSLGCYDAAQECAAIACAAGELERILTLSREDLSVRGTLCVRLGTACGAVIAILFL